MTGFSRRTKLGVTAVVMMLTVTAAHTAEPTHPSFSQLDSDGSGEITRSEFDALRAARFAASDTDGDGVLSQSELEAAAAKRSSARVTRMLNRLDSDGDGALSPSELAAQPNTGRVFARLDADGSGAISQAEFDAGREKMQRRSNNKAQSND